LRDCGAAVKFVSFEPLLEPLGHLDLTGIAWAIVGGESGVGWRPMRHAWAREIRDACLESGTSYFFKQSAAYQTELGQSLREEDGSFWTWHQFPDAMDVVPVPAEPHKYSGEEV
jgi:protein gp37